MTNNSTLNNPKRITIVGGGLSGTSVLAHQVKQVKKQIKAAQKLGPIAITIVDPSDHIGPGNPYKPPLDTYLLNQPAYAMSPFEGEPDHFIKWLQHREPESNKVDLSNSFQPRRVYGEYLKDIFTEALQSAQSHDIPLTIERQQSVITQADFSNSKHIIIHSQNGQRWKADSLIIADGHHKNELLSDLRGQDNYYDTILNCEKFINQPQQYQKTLIIGSGQDMMDRLSDLHHCGYDGIIDVVSRNGVLPWVFDPKLYAPDCDMPPYALKYFTAEEIINKTNFSEINQLWNQELLNADDLGYGPAHILGVFYKSEALAALSKTHPNNDEWQKQINYISAFYGNPTPKERHTLLEKLIQTNKLHQIFSGVSEDQVCKLNDGGFSVTFDDGSYQKYDAIINSASCARSLKTRHGNIRSPILSAFNAQSLIKWDIHNDGIVTAGVQNDPRLFYAGPYSYAGKWGVETYRTGHEEIARLSLQPN